MTGTLHGWVLRLGLVLSWSMLLAATVGAQSLGTFRWQLQPFCNVVTVNVVQAGAVFTVDGFDDQCGASQRASLVGTATQNPDGTIGFGLHIVTVPGGAAVALDARISVASLGGVWTDSAGNSGTFIFNGNAGGAPRPAATSSGDVSAVTAGLGLTGGGLSGDLALAIDPAVTQRRVSGTCRTGEAMRLVQENGSVTCVAVGSGSGDITEVIAGTGLTGGATTGAATLQVAFGGPGSAASVARSDHDHAVGTNNTAVGAQALQATTSGGRNVAVGYQGLDANTTGSNNVAVGPSALGVNTSGGDNVAVGDSVLALNSTGGLSVGIGATALSNATGSANVAVGASAGNGLLTGTNNTFLGRGANAGATSLTNATAIGAGAIVSQNDSLVLGDGNTRVGIGTSAPVASLDIVNSVIAVMRLTSFTTNPVFSTSINLRKANGTQAAPLALNAGETIGQLGAAGWDGSSIAGNSSAVTFDTTENWTPSSRGVRIRFVTTANGSPSAGTRMTIDHDGQVGIGTTNPQDVLHVSEVRVVNCVKNGAGTQIAGTCASDARFKREITPFPSILGRVTRLQPVHYFWRADEFPERAFGRERTYGLVAQDVEQVMPELVHDQADGFKAVDYSQLPLVLLQALRELADENQALRARLEQVEARIAAFSRTGFR